MSRDNADMIMSRQQTGAITVAMCLLLAACADSTSSETSSPRAASSERASAASTQADEHDEVVLLDCLTHALNCLASDDMRTIVPGDVGTTLAPDVSATVIDFLDRVMR